MSDLQMDYMLIKRERLDALLRVVEVAMEVAELAFVSPGTDLLDRLDAALHELNKLNED
jgi:hypothetical protein